MTKDETWRKKRRGPEWAKDYREIKRKIRTEMKIAKETWIQGQCQEVEACLRKNDSKKAYQLVKNLTTEKQSYSTTIQDKSGKCLTEENEILNRWTEYCSDFTTMRLMSRKEHTEQIFNLRILCEKYLPCLHRLQEGLWPGMARSSMGNYEVIQHKRQHHTSNWKSVWQDSECSPVQWQHRRMGQNYSRSPTMVSTLTNPH